MNAASKMNATSLSNIPGAMGISLLHAGARASAWVFAKFMMAPFTWTALIALSAGAYLSIGNALYWQTSVHPAPLFYEQPAASAPLVAPPIEVAPAPDRTSAVSTGTSTETIIQPMVSETTSPESVSEAVTHERLYAAQERLSAMGLLEGTVDGFYGPKTATAIRSFELRNGLSPKGALSASIIEKILQSPIIEQVPSPQTNAQAQSVVPSVTPDLQSTLLNATPIADANTSLAAVTPIETPSGAQALAALVQASFAPSIESAPIETAARSFEAASTSTATIEPIVNPVAEAIELTSINPMSDAQLIANIQRGLASLGFLHGRIDGVAGDTTARAIRNFEVYHNYEVSGRVSAELLELLLAANAEI